MNLDNDFTWCVIACSLITVLLFIIAPAICFAPSGIMKLLIFTPTFIITIAIAKWLLE